MDDPLDAADAAGAADDADRSLMFQLVCHQFQDSLPHTILSFRFKYYDLSAFYLCDQGPERLSYCNQVRMAH